MAKSATGRQLLPASDPVARFVVSMSAGRNAIEPALHRLVKARDKDRDPEFTVNVLAVMGFLWEASAALNAYRREYPEVQTFLRGLPDAVREDLKVATTAAQRIGTDALGHSRNSFFHFRVRIVGVAPTPTNSSKRCWETWLIERLTF